MTFTYDLSTDIGRVRLRVGDRRELIDPATKLGSGSGIRSDEEIQLMINDEGSWQKACIAWVQSFLNQLNTEPDFTADWLEIDLESARESYLNMLSELKVWLGVAGAGSTTTTTPSWRSDSLQTEAPDHW
jgi:hypothetical protein